MSETTPQVLSEAHLNVIRDVNRYTMQEDFTAKWPDYAVRDLLNHIDALQALTTQQAWDMRSLELTVENLRGEVERHKQGLDDVWESCRSWRAKGLPADGLESVQSQIGALIAALEGGE